MIGRTDPAWGGRGGLKEWLLQKIEEDRRALEHPACGIKEADQARGRIMAWRDIINTVEPERLEEQVATHAPGAGY